MVQGTGQLIDLGFPQYCSLTILCRLSDRATFISLRMNGYNTEIENILQKDSTFGDGTWSRLLAVPTLQKSRFFSIKERHIKNIDKLTKVKPFFTTFGKNYTHGQTALDVTYITISGKLKAEGESSIQYQEVSEPLEFKETTFK